MKCVQPIYRLIVPNEIRSNMRAATEKLNVLFVGWNAGLQQIMAEVNMELKRHAIPEVLSPKTGMLRYGCMQMSDRA